MNPFSKCALAVILLQTLATSAFALTQKEFALREDALKAAIKRVAESTDTAARMQLNRTFASQLEQALQQDSAFFYPFENIPYLYHVASPDGLVRVITWNVPAPDKQSYFGYVLVRKTKSASQASLHKLRDYRKLPVKLAENKVLSENEWYGALYVKLVERYMSSTRKPVYTLLGLSPTNDGVSNKKVIDVLNVDEGGMCTFGAPIFTQKNKVLHRMIFEYSPHAVMDLMYHEGTRQIVFSELVPMYAQLRGQYRYYVTGEGYNALKFLNGQWQYRENVVLPSYAAGVRKALKTRTSSQAAH